MSAQSPELQAKIQLWRNKAREGTLTQAEMREAIAALRADRAQVPVATGGSKTPKSKPASRKTKPSGDDLFNELENL